ncbi:MAG: hypothetical protein ACI9R3_002012 [Verrucomicrobiales bacterium]
MRVTAPGVATTIENLVVVAADEAPEIESLETTEVTGPPDSSIFQKWDQSHGLAGAEPSGDNDGDFITNVIEFAFGGDPAVPNQSLAGGQRVLPIISGEGTLAFLRRQDREEAGLTYVVQRSSDLRTWEPVGSDMEETARPLAASLDDYERVQISIRKTSQPSYARIQVTLAP